ncbi:DNA methyltransferase [Haloimpatiens sp. FM7315]|uniref:DNA methyltransferase n=1 Tax=Haloimpatiens sp. FM7315 TaxID=3298609 RepID=UPI0035A2EAFE
MAKPTKQFTQAKKRTIIKEHLLIAPELSNRQISKIIGCSPTTVGTIRQELIDKNAQFGHRHTQDDSWTKHPYFIANKDKLLSKGLSDKSLRALKNKLVLDKMAEIGSLSPRYAQRLLYKEKKLANKDKNITVSEQDVRVFLGDVRTGLPQIADGSVSLCFVDIPYDRKAVEELTPHIAKTAARILSDGGSLLLMVGGSHLDIALNKLTTTDKALKFQWDIAYVCQRGTPLIQGRRVTTAVKHILWMVKGKYDGPIQYDLIYTPPDNADKEPHPWGQSVEGIKCILERWSVEGDTIADIMCGGGSTAQAALELGGRKLVLSDIDPKSVKTTKNLVAKMFGAK